MSDASLERVERANQVLAGTSKPSTSLYLEYFFVHRDVGQSWYIALKRREDGLWKGSWWARPQDGRSSWVFGEQISDERDVCAQACFFAVEDAIGPIKTDDLIRFRTRR